MADAKWAEGWRRGMQGWVRKIGAAAVAVMLCAGVRVPFANADDAAAPATQSTDARQRISFNADWRFTRNDAPDAHGQLDYASIRPWVIATGNQFTRGGAKPERPAGMPGQGVSYLQNHFDDSHWQLLNLPHDWAIAGPFDLNSPGETGKLPFTGVGWYRKHFAVTPADASGRVYLDVDGAMSHAAVWLNGKFVGGWPYGYASFELDLTPYLMPGDDNVLAIRLENPRESSRWYPGAGLYRNVWLVKTQAVHVGQWGTYITTPKVSADAATVEVATTVVNSSHGDASITVRTALRDAGSADATALAELQVEGVKVAAGKAALSRASITLPHPQLWDLTSPHLYTADTTLEQDGRVIDHYQTSFGIRTTTFDPEKGFMLNGKLVQMQGVCDHGDLGALGTAVNTRGLERQLEILRGMGCNAIRTSHNPPPPELLQLCDRMGFLVMDECFDCWAKGKNRNDYNLLWHDWHEKDWRAQLRRDRNHPSVVMWSIGNEVPDFYTKAGPAIARSLTEMAHEEDPTRPTTFACNYWQKQISPDYAKAVDVWGVNYQPQNYANDLERHPNLPLFGSETSSTVSSRGEYMFPFSNDRTAGMQNFQVTSYDTTTPPWATSPDEQWKNMDQNRSVFGEFVWTGFDYLGEPTPFSGDVTNALNFTDPAERAQAEAQIKALGKVRMPSRSSYFGIVDLAGFPKDRYYLYQSRWRPDLPMAHILPHWNWPDRVGQVTPVFVYTSGDEAELFLNGTSQGRKKKGPFEYRLRWDDVKYQPGELKVQAYKDGKEWASDTVKTTGPAAKLVLTPDRSTIAADGADLSFVTIAVSDSGGVTVPRSSPAIAITIDGPGELLAMDNGDPTDLTPFPAPHRKAFNGLALAIVRSQPGSAGSITLHATADGLDPATTTITSQTR
jgi:beta-galactosidase